MAEDLRQDFKTLAAVTITLDSLANTGTVTSGTVALGNPSPVAVGLEIKLDGLAGSVDNVEIRAKFSLDGGADFDTDENDTTVGLVRMNGTTAVNKVINFEVKGPDMQIRAVNLSGAALAASGNTIEFSEIHGDQV